jgi:hypothetical protein
VKSWLDLLVFILIPAITFSQVRDDSAANLLLKNDHEVAGSHFSLMFNGSVSFYTAKDIRINDIFNKYGYRVTQELSTAGSFEAAVLPLRSKMVFGINARIILSKQDLITTEFSISMYRRFYQVKSLLFLGGKALGEHFDRIVLNKNLPPQFDSLAEPYRRTLSLDRIGLIAEPTAKVFWHPLQTKKFQIGIFTAVGYAFDTNSRWRLGYYPQNSNRFKRIKKPTGVNTKEEFGWTFSGGMSVGFYGRDREV